MKNMKSLVHNILPKIPHGLGDQLLKRKYGKHHCKLADLLLQKFSIESILEQDPNDLVKDALIEELKQVFAQIESITNYLKIWYTAYLNLCSKCQSCKFNCKNRSCSYYGNKMPSPDLDHPNRTCSHCSPKQISEKIHINN
jgi:hypothetical protein